MTRLRLLVPVLGLLVALTGRPLAAHAQGWGDVKGQVVWAEDTIPSPAAIDVTKDKDACLKCGPLFSDAWVINKANKGVRYTLVWLVDATDPKKPLPSNPALKPPAKEPTMDQPCCMFEPHVLAVQQGQDLLVKNTAAVAHNIHWVGNPLRNPGGNVIIPPGGSYTIKNLKADRLPLKISCDIHPWMSAWLGVFAHPYFAVTDANGNFEIKGAPAGKYNLVIWHEDLGFRGGAAGRNGTPIDIKAGGATDLGKFDLKSKY